MLKLFNDAYNGANSVRLRFLYGTQNFRNTITKHSRKSNWLKVLRDLHIAMFPTNSQFYYFSFNVSTAVSAICIGSVTGSPIICGIAGASLVGVFIGDAQDGTRYLENDHGEVVSQKTTKCNNKNICQMVRGYQGEFLSLNHNLLWSFNSALCCVANGLGSAVCTAPLLIVLHPVLAATTGVLISSYLLSKIMDFNVNSLFKEQKGAVMCNIERIFVSFMKRFEAEKSPDAIIEV